MLQGSHSVHIEYQVEVSQVLTPEELKTTTDKTAQLKTVADKEVNEGKNCVTISSSICTSIAHSAHSD